MLEKYGLNNYENKVYMTLLELHQENARTISKLSGVPLGRIYDILDSLVNLKLVVQNTGRPKKYFAVEPEIAIKTLLSKQREELGLLEKSSTNEIQELTKIYNSQPRDKLIWKVAIGEEIRDTYFQFLNEVNHELLIFVDIGKMYDQVKEELYAIRQTLSRLDSRGVSIRILVSIGSVDLMNQLQAKEPELIASFSTYETRLSEVQTHPFTIIDGRKVILKLVHPTNHDEMLAAIYFDEMKLSSSLEKEFENIWKSSHPLSFRMAIENPSK